MPLNWVLSDPKSKKIIVEEKSFSEPKAPIFESDSDKEEEKEVIVEEEKPAFHPINDYRASRKMVHDLVHTNLDVRFEWAKAYLHGKAILTLKPHFYPSNRLELDAKGFEIREVALLSTNQGKTAKTPLKYTYDGKMINIELNKSYVKDEKYNIFIDYTAKPDELPKGGGSEAITEDKGLYFINKDGKDPNKPMQIWTQGETEASSCWFPTIDAPNQKSTQEIAMTVDKKYITLSNGLMTSTKTNADGTRTDIWKQNKPHAPYLFMMAVGEFAIVKDKWRNIEVNYYVEPKYKDSAKDIFGFGKTPKMIEFFSKILKVDYPWDKYHQIIVRDYVSGAMENSSAVIFGEFAQQTKRELLDLNHEDIVAHELFHHWFGDLVTCESFSNLPLNESFATYAPYLWFESEYGQDFMDHERYKSLQGYFQEAEETTKDLIRYFYKSREDMFDAHSYNKGGGVLHMLRRYVGDDAFFTALNLYLTQNKFGSAEIHDLRLAFEKVTGEDLNWFFNQWFLQS
ncbi:MAG: M1 family peptidase, partial [Bacteroidetes bacterium]